MSASELFIAIGGTLLVLFFFALAFRREREPDGFQRRGSLAGLLRSNRSAVPPSVPLRPAAARILAERDRARRAATAASRSAVTKAAPPEGLGQG